MELIGEERERRGGGHGIGRVRGDRYGKGRKNYQRHLTCSSSHYFPQFLSLENMQQHTKTATTCSLQAPCNNSLGHSAAATIPQFFLPRLKQTGQPDQLLHSHLCFSTEKQKHIETLVTLVNRCGHTLTSLQRSGGAFEAFSWTDLCSLKSFLFYGGVTCKNNCQHATICAECIEDSLPRE